MKKPRFDIGRVFHALGDPTRRAIVEKLRDRPLSVSALAEGLQITLTAVGQHLQILEDSGLVHTEKSGRVRTCSLESGGFVSLEQWMADQRSAWNRRLDRLDRLLEQENRQGRLP